MPSEIRQIAGQGFLIVILLIFTVMLLTKPFPWLPLLDNANLLIHESGHTFLGGFGEFISIIGGTIIQISLPIFFLVYFLYRKQYLASGFCLFWIGDNLVNISAYVKDARAMLLPTVNEGVHDWNYILAKFHLLAKDQIIGNLVYLLGILCVLAGVIFCMYVVYSNTKNLVKTRS